MKNKKWIGYGIAAAMVLALAWYVTRKFPGQKSNKPPTMTFSPNGRIAYTAPVNGKCPKGFDLAGDGKCKGFTDDINKAYGTSYAQQRDSYMPDAMGMPS